jgi:deoxyribodipyrimidine photolyase-related protein
MSTLRLILGDQLNPLHPWFHTVDADVVHVLMEVRQETDYVLHHAQKVLAIFAAMRDFARHLREAGYRVRYVAIDDASNRQSITENLQALAAHYGTTCVQYQAPDEWRLDAQLANWADQQCAIGLPVQMVSTAHFLTERLEAKEMFAQRKQWLMEHFYRQMRLKHLVLLDTSGKPEGGQWNFDHDNRKPWPGLPAEPADWRTPHDHSALWQTIEAAGVKTFGNPQGEQLAWPLNRAEALAHLHSFVAHALPHFGDFQDALTSKAWRLFHSLLSFVLNVKMLNPREVIDSAEAAWRAGDTQMACMRQAIGQSLEHAYAHHIQRLMVIGNFALLAGLNPQAVHHWYLGVYIDAFEWVELPNTLGMSQFADGGLLATKPYVSSAAYIDRMGDHCKGCHYQKKERLGERACPFNALYWDFHLRHDGALRRNPRIGMVYRQIDKMSESDRDAIKAQAAHWQARLDTL